MPEEEKSAPAVVLDEEARNLKLLQIKAEARKAIAEAEAATKMAGVPESRSKPLNGVVDLGEKGGASLASVVAAAELSRAAKVIADEVSKKAQGGRVLIVEDKSVAESDAVYLEVTSRLGQFKTALEDAQRAFQSLRIKPLDAGVSLAMIAGLGGLVADVVGLFRIDYEVDTREVVLDRMALTVEVVRQLKPGVTAVLPGLSLVENSKVLTDLRDLLSARYALERSLLQTDYQSLQPVQRQIDSHLVFISEQRSLRAKALADNDSDRASRIDSVLAEARSELQTLELDQEFQTDRANVESARGLLTAFDSFVGSLTTIPPGAKYAPLVGAALREQLRDSEGNARQETHLLYLTISSGGADVVTRKGLFHWGHRIAFLGAIQATYLLAAANGTIETAGAVTQSGAATFDFSELKFDSFPGWTQVQGAP